MSKAFMHQLITEGSLDISNMSKAHMTEIIIVKSLYMTTDITKGSMDVSNVSKASMSKIIVAKTRSQTAHCVEQVSCVAARGGPLPFARLECNTLQRRGHLRL